MADSAVAISNNSAAASGAANGASSSQTDSGNAESTVQADSARADMQQAFDRLHLKRLEAPRGARALRSPVGQNGAGATQAPTSTDGDGELPGGDAADASAPPDRGSGKRERDNRPRRNRDAAPPPDLRQSHLAVGFARLTRQQKAAERTAAELASREAQITAAQEAAAERIRAVEAAEAKWQADNKARSDELAMLDGDDYAWLERAAAKRGMTRAQYFNNLTKRMANEGKLDADDVNHALKQEIEAIKAKDLAREKADADRRAAEKLAADQREKIEQAKHDQAQVVAAERAKFFEELGAWKEEFPLVAAEAAASENDLFQAAYSIAAEYVQRTRKVPTGRMVMAHVEAILKSQAAGSPAQNHQAARAAEVTTAQTRATAAASEAGNGAVKSANSPEGNERLSRANGLSSRSNTPGPKTLTHRHSVEQSGQTLPPPKNDNERMQRAIAKWNADIAARKQANA